MMSRLRRPVLCAALLLVSVCATKAQSSEAESGLLKGMRGRVAVASNSSLGQVTIVFTSDTSLNPNSSQIVFVLQSELSKYPAAWSGSGQVLVGDGVLIVVPADSDRAAPILEFKFSELPDPDSVKSWTMEAYDVYGIARYGETTALGEDQIASLESTGRLAKTAKWSADGAGNKLDLPQAGMSVGGVEPDGAGPVYCQSGGPGSSSCNYGGSGCSITCKPGYYSCCTYFGCSCQKGQ